MFSTSRDSAGPYVIREQGPTDAQDVGGHKAKDGVSNDTATHEVTVKVTDDGRGALVAMVGFAGAACIGAAMTLRRHRQWRRAASPNLPECQ